MRPFPTTRDDVRSWPRAEALAPHARAVVAEADSADISDPTARLMNQLGLLLSSKALYAEAEPLYQRSLAIREETLGPDHPMSAPRSTTSRALSIARPLCRGRAALQRSLAIREKALGKTIPMSAPRSTTSRNSIARKAAMPRPSRSISALLRSRKALGQDHPDVGTSLNNLAELYRSKAAMPRPSRSISAPLRSAKRRSGRTIPMSAPRSTTSRGSIARKAAMPRPSRSISAPLRSAKRRSAQDHPDVGTSLNNLAVLYRAQGRYADAEPLYQRSLAIRERRSARTIPMSALAQQPRQLYSRKAAMPRPSRSISAPCDREKRSAGPSDVALAQQSRGSMSQGRMPRRAALPSIDISCDQPQIGRRIQSEAASKLCSTSLPRLARPKPKSKPSVRG